MKKLFLLAFFSCCALFLSAQIMITEFHYDNTGGDTGEFVEITAPSGTDLTGYRVYLYNGSNGTTYPPAGGSNPTIISLATDLALDDGCNAIYTLDLTSIQNGNPDGLALTDAGGGLVQFISYEGSFMATNGPYAGMNSIDVGVSEPTSAPIGSSIQFDSTVPEWVYTPGTNTKGAPNFNEPACAAPVPTMGEWGLIVLFLMLMSMGTVFFMRRQTVLAGTGGMTISGKVPFNGAAYGKILMITLGLVVTGFAVAVLAFGYQLTNADIPGILIATPILAYLLHLLGFGGAKK